MMKRTRLPPTAAVLASALLAAAAPAPAQPSAQDRATAAADRMHKGNGADGGPAELLRSAQAAMRRGQAAEANELLERAETRLLLQNAAGQPAGGEPARHVSEARRALLNRDRAEAMRHTNLAIATVRDGDATGSDAGARLGGAQGGGGPGAVDRSGMGALPVGGRAVVRDAGTAGISVARAEGIVLAQAGGGTGTGGGGARGASPAPSPGAGARGLPPGDTIPGWSGLGGGSQVRPGGATGQPGLLPNQDFLPDSFSRRGTSPLDFSSPLSGPGTSGITGGEPARVGGAPPADTSRAPGSSGIGPTGPLGFGASNPGPLR